MFTKFKKAVAQRLDFLIERSIQLYLVDVEKDILWDTYLNAFPQGSNPIHRERTQHDCSCCRSFIKNYGGIVAFVDIDGKKQMMSIWDVSEQVPHPYNRVAEALSELVRSSPIRDIFLPDEHRLGTDYNFETIEGMSQPKRWDHFYCEIPKSMVYNKSVSIETTLSRVRQTKQVIQRSFEELTPSAVQTVLELIEDKNLYRGEEHKSVLSKFQKLQREYIVSTDKDMYCWETAVTAGRVAAIRNTAIGTLLVNLSASMNLEDAVKAYEKVVAPTNYKRPKALITESMKKAAVKKVTELGLMDSLGRRYAHLRDVSVRNVLWVSGKAKKVMQNPFDLLETTPKALRKTDNVQEVGIEYFLQNILPDAEQVELYFENQHESNLMSLIAPANLDAPSLFKWKNGFSWSYNGDLADSSIKRAVKTRGGAVDGVLRCSLRWAEGDTQDNSDLDLHCTSEGEHIFYGNDHGKKSDGRLDVDIRYPKDYGNQNIVENITWANKETIPVGTYKFSVRNFAHRGHQKGFEVELEFDGNIYNFNYPTGVKQNESIPVVDVYFDGENFSIRKSHIQMGHSTKDIWNIPTNSFVPVSTIMCSPNHWDEQTGNKHYFFFLEGCKNTGTARGFFNEFLKPELNEHRKVFEALGDKMRVAHDDDQLSGVGFSSTMKNSVTVKVNNKPIKINFTDDTIVSASSKAQIPV